MSKMPARRRTRRRVVQDRNEIGQFGHACDVEDQWPCDRFYRGNAVITCIRGGTRDQRAGAQEKDKTDDAGNSHSPSIKGLEYTTKPWSDFMFVHSHHTGSRARRFHVAATGEYIPVWLGYLITSFIPADLTVVRLIAAWSKCSADGPAWIRIFITRPWVKQERFSARRVGTKRADASGP